MKSLLIRQLRLLLYWMVVYQLFRLVFLIYHHDLIHIDQISISEVLTTFRSAFYLDIATACYILLLALLPDMLQLLTGFSIFRTIKLIIVGFFTYVHGIIAMTEVGIYAEWQSKLTYKALIYLRNPQEIAQTAPTAMFVLLIGLWAIFSTVFFLAYLWLTRSERKEKARLRWPLIPGFLLSFSLIFIGARGGLNAIPISISSVYFSQYNILNLAAVNPTYHFTVNLLDAVSLKDHNPFEVMPND
jgi:hypothetical protein